MRFLAVAAAMLMTAGGGSTATNPTSGTHIVIRDDRPDSLYRALGARFPAVAKIGRRGDGVLIASQWVLTAAHVAQGADRAGITVSFPNRSYTIDRATLHPRWTDLGPHDIGLLHLAEPVRDVAPIPLYEGSAESGQLAIIVGHGDTRTGLGGPWVQDGVARGATSRVEDADSLHLVFRFRHPANASDLEGAPGRGDSGGPALLMVRDSAYVAGISSAGYDGEHGPGTYGAVDHFTRVSRYASWIRDAMNER